MREGDTGFCRVVRLRQDQRFRVRCCCNAYFYVFRRRFFLYVQFVFLGGDDIVGFQFILESQRGLVIYESGGVVVFDCFGIVKSFQNWVCLQKLFFQFILKCRYIQLLEKITQARMVLFEIDGVTKFIGVRLFYRFRVLRFLVLTFRFIRGFQKSSDWLSFFIASMFVFKEGRFFIERVCLVRQCYCYLELQYCIRSGGGIYFIVNDVLWNCVVYNLFCCLWFLFNKQFFLSEIFKIFFLRVFVRFF